MFQSHIGSIKSGHCVCFAQGTQSFNPTLVRLKAAPRKTPLVLLVCFNPTLVRLKEAANKARVQYDSSFNPTLVRLKDRAKLP